MSTVQVEQGGARGSSLVDWVRQRARDLAPFATLILLVVFFAVATGGRSLDPINLRNIFAQIATLSIVATGMTFVLLCGEIDLSVAAVATLSGVIAAMLYGTGIDLGFITIGGGWEVAGGLFAALAATGVAALFGLLNGWTSMRIGLPTFMATLAVMQICTGLGQFVTQGSIIYTLPPVAKLLGQDFIGNSAGLGFQIVILCGMAALLIGHFILTYTKFGRYVYMTGSNREAARLSGINTKNIVASCLVISGFCAGIAGVLNTGRLGSAQGYGLEDILLDSISAVVLGGTSLFGGEGGIKNTIIGLLIFGVLSNGINLLGLDAFVKMWVRGVVLLIALIINIYALKLRKDQAAV
jgi:ribose transport system permease protein